MSTPQIPGMLYLRLSDSSICFARYEQRQTPFFESSIYNLRSQVSLAINLKEALQTEKILQTAVKETLVMVSGPVTPVPLSDFQEEDCNTIYDYCFPKESPQRVFYDIVPTANTVLLFALEEQTCSNIEEVFENVRYVSSLTSVLRHFSVKGTLGNPQKRLFVYRHEKNIDIAVFEETRLIMVNSYLAQTEADVAYYVFNISKHLGMDPSSAIFYIAGDNEPQRNRIVEALQQFAANVYGINPTAEYNRHIISTTPGIPYDLMTLLID